MYNIPYFKEQDKQVLLEFIEEYPLAFVTGIDAEGKPVATQIPMMVVERNSKLYLQGHMMRNTDHHKAFKQNPLALVVFTGPNCYVSASWYTDPHGGSTWNYMSVHIKGTLQFLPEDQLKNLMQDFTLKHEEGNANSPTVFNNLPESYHAIMLPAIEGFEMKIDQLEHVFKLSQNRDEGSYTNIIKQLETKDGFAKIVAKEMKKRKDKHCS